MAEKRLSKQEAQDLYDNLQRAVGTMMAKGKAAEAKAAAAKTAAPKAAPRPKAASSAAASPASPRVRRSRGLSGEALAIMTIAVFCCAKVTLSALEASGIASAPPVEAAVVAQPRGPQWSKEEVKVLTALDSRRVQLEERASRLEQRETEAASRDRDLAVKLTELKDLTERLKAEREKGDKQRDTQLDQLANVYGSMNPPEAAHLLEQLDIQVALSLVERMPEKRMGQILSLMNAQRALELTNLLSKRRS